MVGNAALRVGERDDENELLRRIDLAVDEFAPHVATVRRLHAVQERAAGPQVDLAGVDLEPARSPPLLEARGLGPCLPHLVTRGVEDAGDLERLHRSTTTLKPPQKKRLPSNGIFFGSIIGAMRLSFITFLLTLSRCLRFL